MPTKLHRSSVAADGERLAGVLVDDVQELQNAGHPGSVELEVECPDLSGYSVELALGLTLRPLPVTTFFPPFCL